MTASQNFPPLNQQLKALEQLQEIDLKIDRISKEKGAIPLSLKSLDDSVNRSKNAITSKNTEIEELKKVLRQTQAAIDLNRDRLTRSTTRLESVQNSQEYQAVSKEQEQLRKLSLSLDEQVKKTNTDIEAAQGSLTGLSAQLEKVQGEYQEQAGKLSGQSSSLDTQIQSLNQERTQFTTQVEPRTLSLYNRVRSARAGIGIAPAVGGRCLGCNMMVPPQLFNEIQKGSALHSCPSCHRILFVKT